MRGTTGFGVVRLDRDSDAINEFIAVNNLTPVTLLFEHDSDVDLENWIHQALTGFQNVHRLYVLDSHLSNIAVILATCFLKNAVDVCVVCETLTDPDPVRLLRIFHGGGLCMSLADLSDEFEVRSLE